MTTTERTHSASLTDTSFQHRVDEPRPTPGLWRVAGGLAIAHAVILLGSFAMEGTASAEHGTSPSEIARTFGDLSLARAFGAGYVEALSFFVLTPAIVLIAWLFSRRTLSGRLAAQTFAAFGVVYVASTLAVGFPPGAAGLYAAHHGVDPVSLAMVLDIRNFAFFLQVAVSAAMALALGVAALSERLHTRWVGWGGVAVGVVGIVAVPFAHNVISMLWLVWWVGAGILMLRAKSARD
jgi:hypothetical protein